MNPDVLHTLATHSVELTRFLFNPTFNDYDFDETIVVGSLSANDIYEKSTLLLRAKRPRDDSDTRSCNWCRRDDHVLRSQVQCEFYGNINAIVDAYDVFYRALSRATTVKDLKHATLNLTCKVAVARRGGKSQALAVSIKDVTITVQVHWSDNPDWVMLQKCKDFILSEVQCVVNALPSHVWRPYSGLFQRLAIQMERDQTPIFVDHTDGESSDESSTNMSFQEAQVSDDDSHRVCPICLDTKEHLSITDCGHVFCTPCVQNIQYMSCPICRRSNPVYRAL